ncbi:MAG: hypothetical protein COW65_17365 [Cytophagales bacterium CG18_big_fil_WC_8_21_14_2_50_42_9]|nr:MAG: hypothetical protein COW65_17365 [Cytophagales bacterium CG18_big_fil_WC_8_21_14_2_50_42_9]
MGIALFILIPLGLWLLSIYWLSKWTRFWTFFLLNLILFLAYLALLTKFGHELLGVDPYGLSQLFLILLVIIGHILAGFIFAFFKRKHLKVSN